MMTSAVTGVPPGAHSIGARTRVVHRAAGRHSPAYTGLNRHSMVQRGGGLPACLSGGNRSRSTIL